MDNITQVGDCWILHTISPHLLIKKIPLDNSWSLLLSEDQKILFEYPVGSFQTAQFSCAEEALLLNDGIKWTPPSLLHHTHLYLTNKDPFTLRFVVQSFDSRLSQSSVEFG
jgi:hypothetical protein